MFDKRRSPRQESGSPISFRLVGIEAEGELVNLSGTGALFRFDPGLAIGPGAVGELVVFTAWHDVGAILRPQGRVVRYFEEPDGKHLAVRYLSDEADPL